MYASPEYLLMRKKINRTMQDEIQDSEILQ